ncbi:MAG: amino acid permease [Novosphingobium sp.]
MTIRVHTLSWRMIATIGVAIVVAGQFSGWNYGLAFGWSNMVAAGLLMLVFYAGLLQCLSELSATWPSAGGLANYSRLAYGDWAGGLLSVSMALGLIACAGAVANFIASYAATVIGAGGLATRIALFMGVMALHLRGTKEAMWMVVLAGAVAIATLLGFAQGTAVFVQTSNFELDNQALSTHGVIQAIPFALWLYLGVEQAVTASEEAANPAIDMPRGLMLALVILTVTAAGVLICAPGAGGVSVVSKAGDPLLAAILAQGSGHAVLANIIGVGAIFGLLASFFSITYSASRQLFDLSRTGFFPKPFATVTEKGTPVAAFIAVALSGFLVSLVSPERILLAAVLLFTASYFLTALAFVRLRKTMGHVERSYRALGGLGTGIVTLGISLIIFYACLNIDWLSLALIGSTFAYVVLHRRILQRRS